MVRNSEGKIESKTERYTDRLKVRERRCEKDRDRGTEGETESETETERHRETRDRDTPNKIITLKVLPFFHYRNCIYRHIF